MTGKRIYQPQDFRREKDKGKMRNSRGNDALSKTAKFTEKEKTSGKY